MPFFHYRALDDLRDDAAAQDAALHFAPSLARVAEPVRIGERTASNRMAVHPMEGCDGNLDGTPGELTFRRWRRFAEGGAAVLWGEATAVLPEARANPRQLLITTHTIGELKRLLDETRTARAARFGSTDGFLVGLQLTHSGRWSHAQPILARHDDAIDVVRGSKDATVIDDAALEHLEERYVDAALLARDAGFDFVDIKQCHTYLLNELLGARSRDGHYGGSFAARTRFVRDVFARIHDIAGASLMLATRMNVFDGIPYHAGPDGIGEPVAPSGHGWGADPATRSVPISPNRCA